MNSKKQEMGINDEKETIINFAYCSHGWINFYWFYYSGRNGTL